MNPENTLNDNAGSKPGSKSLQVLEVLKTINDHAFSDNIVKLGYVKNLSISDGFVKFDVHISEGSGLVCDGVRQAVDRAFQGLKWINGTEISVSEGHPVEKTTQTPQPSATSEKPADHRPLGGVTPGENMPDVKHVIAVGSGKGGVGKSTISVNLALALAASGYKVGLMDADVYGPSIPMMLGASGQPSVNEDEKILPLEHSGLKIMSMGFLMASNQAVIWRGPMIHGVIKQFLTDVDWGKLDYLVVDLPPGTGDAPLSLIQAMPLTASIVVTTPQEVAASVAQKSMAMFAKMGVKTLGVIENMSFFDCPDNDKVYYIFGEGGGRKLAEAHNVPLLGEIPIDLQMRKGADKGLPLMLEDPDGNIAKKFKEIAKAMTNAIE